MRILKFHYIAPVFIVIKSWMGATFNMFSYRLMQYIPSIIIKKNPFTGLVCEVLKSEITVKTGKNKKIRFILFYCY